ncbi:hypothetical protein LXL04_026772 [Taraxacum kok-saghyz]
MAITHSFISHPNFRLHTHFTHHRFTTTTRSRPNSISLTTCSSSNHTNVSLFEAAKHTVFRLIPSKPFLFEFALQFEIPFEFSSNWNTSSVDTYLQSGMVVGLGSGVASSFAIEYLGHKLRVGLLNDIIGIPTCVGSESEAEKAGVPLLQYQDNLQIDFTFNDADIMEEVTLNAIIGRQGEEYLIKKKKILDVTKNLVLMVRENQYKSGVEGSIPVLINSVGWLDTAEEIDDLFVGDAEVWRRASIGHAGPTGGEFPLVTREGHNILDVIFTSPIPNLAEVAKLLDNINGVACHGIITKTPCRAVIAKESGICIIDNSVNSDVISL